MQRGSSSGNSSPRGGARGGRGGSQRGGYGNAPRGGRGGWGSSNSSASAFQYQQQQEPSYVAATASSSSQPSYASVSNNGKPKSRDSTPFNANDELRKYQDHLITEAHNIMVQNKLYDDPSTNFVDTHCHLDLILQFKKYDAEKHKKQTKKQFLQDEFFSNAGNSNSAIAKMGEQLLKKFDGCVAIQCDPATNSPSLGIWKEFMQNEIAEETTPSATSSWKIRFTFGIHPHQANTYDDAMEQRLNTNMADAGSYGVAWGECGLDYHYNNSPAPVQQQAFIKQIKRALALNKPLVIHTREADDDCYKILMEHVTNRAHKMHIHCFTDSAQFADKILKQFTNCYFGFTGVLTYDNAMQVQQCVATTVPLNRILLETDAPYMPANIPNFQRNKKVRLTAHCAHVVFVAQKIADLKKIPIAQVLKQTRQNAKDVYGI